MRKIKVMIASMFGAIALVFACVFGTRINAADVTIGTHSVTADSFYSGATKSNSKISLVASEVDIFTLQTGKNIYRDYGAYATAQSATLVGISGKTFSSEIQTGGSRTLTVELGTNQKAEVSIYLYDEGGSKTVKIGNGATTDITNNQVKEYTGTLYSDSNVIALEGSNICFLECDVTVSNITRYAVTFHTNGANETVPVQNIVSGEKATDPGVITKTNSVFDGWFTKDGTDDDWGNQWNFTTNTVTAATDLYAKWSVGTVYTVTFKNGDETYATKYVTDGENDNKLLDWPTDPVRAGYEFDGWYNSNTPYTTNSTFNADIVLTAQFTLSTIAIGSTASFKYDNTALAFTGVAETLVLGKFTFVENSNNKTAFTIGDNALKIGSSATLVDGAPDGNYISFAIPANSLAKIAITGRSSNADTNSELNVKTKTGSATKFTFVTNVNETKYTTVSNDAASALTIYLYRSGSNQVRIDTVNVSVIASTSDLNAKCAVECIAEANSAKTVLRFIGVISGIESLNDIESIELLLKKDGVANSGHIYLTTCYISITGASKPHSTNDNTYYVLFRLNNANQIAGSTISKKIIVTFTDGTTSECDYSDIVMPS